MIHSGLIWLSCIKAWNTTKKMAFQLEWWPVKFNLFVISTFNIVLLDPMYYDMWKYKLKWIKLFVNNVWFSPLTFTQLTYFTVQSNSMVICLLTEIFSMILIMFYYLKFFFFAHEYFINDLTVRVCTFSNMLSITF